MRSFHWRIAVPFILLILVSMVILGVYLGNTVKNFQLDNIRFQLEEEAKITAEASLPLFNQGGNLDALAKRLGKSIDARVTIIALDGKVLGDSQENPLNMENHAGRSEVKDALAYGSGESTRYSTTLSQQMMYFAVTVSDGDTVLGIARVALPLTSVVSLVNRVSVTVWLETLTVALLAILAAWLIARTVTRPIRELNNAVKLIASGKLGQKTVIRTRDEIGQLSSSFNEMSTSFSKMVGELSAERTRLVSVLSNMTDGIIMTDLEGKVVMANRAAEKLFGFKVNNSHTRPLIEVVRDHEVDALLKLGLKTNMQQATQFETGVNRRFVRAIAIPIADKPGGALLIFQDLTELRSTQTMRRELIGNISHELRTPIAGIKAMVETLRDGAIHDKEAAGDFLARIESEVDRLTQIVSEVTELSRIETGKTELNIEPVELGQLIDEAVARMRPLAERQQVTLSTKLSGSVPEISADKNRIRQTIINLLHNAVKFNKPGGSVVVSAGSTSKAVTVSIADTGTGISREDLPHVFERFYIADRARSRSGSGLGLAIAKHTILAHGGDIWATSEEGKGSVFSFSLPLESKAS